jgi:hypothetical protein
MVPCNVLRSLASLVLLSAIAVSASAQLQFDATGITATVTPGATTYWMCSCGTALGATLTDTDGDGIVRYEPSVLPWGGIWLVIDGTTKAIVAQQRGGPVLDPLPFPPKAFPRDNGTYSFFSFDIGSDVPYSTTHLLFWVRPGVGSWVGARQGGVGSLFGYEELFDVRTMVPVNASPTTPSGLQPGDFFVLTGYAIAFWTGGLVDSRLSEAIGGGIIHFARPTGSEDDGKMTINLARIEGSDGAVSVRYATEDDTAHAGVHYQSTTGTAFFEPGRMFQSFDVPVIDDKTNAAAKFKVVLSEPSGATIGRTSLVVAIPDNDSTPTVIVERKTVSEGDGGPQEVPLKISLDHTAPQPVTVDWQSTSTGQPNGSGTLQFATGEKEKSILLAYTADDTYGGGFVRIRVVTTNAVNALVVGGISDGFLDIVEDELPPSVTIQEVAVSETAQEAVLTVRLSAPTTRDYLVAYETRDGKATAPQDYIAATPDSFVTILAGQTSATIRIPIRDDEVLEGTEAFQVVATATSAGSIEVAATVTIMDNEPFSRRRSVRQ